MNEKKRSASDAGLNEDSNQQKKRRTSLFGHFVEIFQATCSTVSSMLSRIPSTKQVGYSTPFVDLSQSDNERNVRHLARVTNQPSSDVVEVIDLTGCPSPQILKKKKVDIPMQPHSNRQSSAHPLDYAQPSVFQPKPQRRRRLWPSRISTGSSRSSYNPIQLTEKEKYRELLCKRSRCDQVIWPRHNITARNLEAAQDKNEYRKLLSLLSDGNLQVSTDQERPATQKIPRLFTTSGSRSKSKSWATEDSQIPSKYRTVGSLKDRMSKMKRALSSSVTKKVASSERPIGELSPKEKPREYESISTEMTLVKEMAGKLAHKPPIHSSDVIYTGIQPRSKTAVSKLDRQQREQPEVILISDSPETQPVAPVVTDMEIRSPPLNFKTRFDKKWVDGLKAEHHESHRQQKLEVSKAEKLLEESLRHEEEIEREIEERVKQLNLTLNAAEVSLVPLTQSQLEMVYNAFIPQPPDEVLSEAFNISIKRRDIATLKGPEWLNDEIINFYFNLIADRSKKHSNLPKVHIMSSFFYPSLVANGYGRVKRWTKKVNIFNMDLILLPVHLGIHWCLAVIDFRKCCIRYYDSMKGVNQQCLQVLANYLPQESQDKLKKSFSMNGWQYETVQEIPEQMNGSDCGVFSCKFAEYVSRDAPIDFSQEHMPFFRLRMVYEILNKTLL